MGRVKPAVHLDLVDDGTIAIITLDDETLGNPMTPEMGDAFRAAVERLKGLETLRAAIVRGAGHPRPSHCDHRG